VGPVAEQKILQEARDRLKKCIDDDAENRKMALDDLKFVAEENAQWPEIIRTEREAEGRPCLVINKLPVFIDQVVGDQRMNRPSIKVIPVDDKSDPKVARILSGWIKHVQQLSTADVAIDHGFEHAVACGYGAMRVITKYVSDDSFDQEAYIEQVDNALAIYWGKHSKYDCSDAPYCFIVSDMDREEFKEKYDVEPIPFNTADSQYVEGWVTSDTVRVVEYFVKEKEEKTLYQLEDGRTVWELAKGDTYTKKRKVYGSKVMWYLLSGNKILDSKDWPGKKYIPIVPIWGKELNVGGKRIVRGLIRNAKDPQRMYNYWQSCDTEVVALQPRVPYMITPDQLAGHEAMWNNCQKKNYPYLLSNPDPKAPGWPQRQTPPQASSAMVEKIAMSDQEMRDVVGLQKASLGMQSNERSGVAIRERKREGDVGTFSFMDNLARSVEYLGRILVDIAPVILDTARVVRLGLDDGEFDFDAVNVQDIDSGKIMNDLSIGTYDVVVTVGPSFSTQRTEAQQSMQQFLQYYPAAAPLIGDLYAKAMDWPGADEVSHRLEYLLPPEVRAKKEAERAERAGESVRPPTGPPAPPPDPIQMLKVKEEELKLQEIQIKLEQEKVKLEALKIDNELTLAQSKEAISKTIDEILSEGGEQENISVENIPKRAEGGEVLSGKPYIVGENGPEVVVPKQDGDVIPNYGLREDLTPKRTGWLGVVPVRFPDGRKGVATEYSIGVDLDGKQVLVPSLVPTLTDDEKVLMMNDIIPNHKHVPDSILQKSIEHAKQRMQQGLSPFKD
jgi:hypothetical protein